MIATDKRTLRRQLRQTRQKIPPAERQRAQAACNRQLKRFALRGKRIAVYWAMGSELRLDDWVRSAQKRGAKVYLPYIEPHSLRLWFTPYPQVNQRAERKRGKSSLHVPQFGGRQNSRELVAQHGYPDCRHRPTRHALGAGRRLL